MWNFLHDVLRAKVGDAPEYCRPLRRMQGDRVAGVAVAETPRGQHHRTHPDVGACLQDNSVRIGMPAGV